MRTGVQLVCCVLLLGGVVLEVAAKPKAMSPAQRAFIRGQALFEKRDFVGAREAFEEAYRIKPHYLVQCNIARCAEASGDLVQATVHFRRCLGEGGAKTPAVSGPVKKELADVEARITTLDISSPGEGGEIRVDGRPAGRTPGQIPVNPGSHVVEVVREGAKPATVTITASGGGRRALTLIPVDVVVARVEPPPPTPTPPPRHDRRTLRPHWFWIAAGATVACAAVTTGLGVAALKSRDSYFQNKTEDDYNRAASRRTLTNVFAGLTAAAAGTATTLFFFTDFKRRGNPERAGDVALGVGVQGRF